MIRKLKIRTILIALITLLIGSLATSYSIVNSDDFLKSFKITNLTNVNTKYHLEYEKTTNATVYEVIIYDESSEIIFNEKTTSLLKNTEIKNGDFEKVFEELTENDFIFLDPPYDTDFSDYENKSFDKQDQERLAKTLEKTKSKFILIIKNTPFIYSLYNKECFKIKSFDNNYAYCVKNRNNRSVEHLIITNY